jgi:hypothetical protein
MRSFAALEEAGRGALGPPLTAARTQPSLKLRRSAGALA